MVWMPIPSYNIGGNQVYRCGTKSQVFIDNLRLFVNLDNTYFFPLSLHSMIKLCK